MSQPDLQRVVYALVRPEQPQSVVEAAEVAFGLEEAIGPDELIDQARGVLVGSAYEFHESRSQTQWGATGPEFQDIILRLGEAVGSGLTVAGVVAALRKVFAGRRAASTAQQDHGLPYRSAPDDSESALRLFADFLRRAFQAPNVKATKIQERDDGWHIVAESGNRRFVGTVTRDGRIVRAKAEPIKDGP